MHLPHGGTENEWQQGGSDRSCRTMERVAVLIKMSCDRPSQD